MKTTYIGENTQGERTYRIYPDSESGLDIGDVIKRTSYRWCAWPAVRGEARPRSTVTHHSTLTEAVARIVAHADDATE